MALPYLPSSLLPLPALCFPRDSQLLPCLPQGATKPGKLDSTARNPLRSAAGLARRARATAHVRNAGSRVSRYTSFRPPSTARLRHNTGRGKFPKPRENALPYPPPGGWACALKLAERGPDRCSSRAPPGARARARKAGSDWPVRRGGERVAGSGGRRPPWHTHARAGEASCRPPEPGTFLKCDRRGAPRLRELTDSPVSALSHASESPSLASTSLALHQVWIP